MVAPLFSGVVGEGWFGGKGVSPVCILKPFVFQLRIEEVPRCPSWYFTIILYLFVFVSVEPIFNVYSVTFSSVLCRCLKLKAICMSLVGRIYRNRAPYKYKLL